MKKRNILFIAILTVLFIVSGCSGVPSGHDKEAYKLLTKANENFSKLNSYVEVKYELNQINSNDYETRVAFLPLSKDENNIMNVHNNQKIEVVFPYLEIKNHEDFQREKAKTTLYITREELENGKVKETTYRDLFQKGELLLFSTNEFDNLNKTLDLNIVEEILKSAKDVKEPKTEEERENLKNGIFHYTGGNFTSHVVPERIKDLKIKEEQKIGEHEFIILSGYIESIPEERGYMFDKLNMEIWINKATNEIVRESYIPAEGSENKGFITYEYVAKNQAFPSGEFYKETPSKQIEILSDLFN